MTWVIGASSLFGYGVMLSDVRVTFPNGTTADIVRKAYPVGNYIAAGFAGSVLIGFQLLESLSEFLVIPPDAGQVAWKPQWVAEQWSPIARKIFDSSPASEKKLRSHFLMVGVSPSEDMGAPQFRRVYIVRFSDPEFRPGFMKKAFTICHIGSGGGVSLYKRALRGHFRLGASSMQAEMLGPSGWAGMLGHSVNIVAAEHPVESVSRHMHIVVCRLGEILEGNNNERVYPPNGSGPIIFEMPKVATSYPEFQALCGGFGRRAEGAIG